MKFHRDEKTVVFIDGANLYSAAKNLDFDIDYKKILQYFNKETNLIRIIYYTAISEDQEYSSVRPLIDWLEYNGYSVVTRPLKEFIDATGRRKAKGSMNVELAVDALSAASYANHIVLFSGDGDFCYLVDAIKRKGAQVTVVSVSQSHPPMVSDELRRRADQFVDVGDIIDILGRDGSGGIQESDSGFEDEDGFDY